MLRTEATHERQRRLERFWHYFNFSSPIPSWVKIIRTIINFVQIIPIIFGWSVSINRDSNELVKSLNSLSQFIVFLNFSSIQITTTFLFIMALLITMLIIAGNAFDFLILNSYFLIVLHLFLDELLPIFVFMTFPILVVAINEFIDDRIDVYYLVFQSISSFLFLFYFSVKTFCLSRPLMVKFDFTAPWNYWNSFYKIFFSPTIILTTLIKNEVIMHDLYYTLCILFSIFNLIFDYRKPYVQPIINIFFFAMSLSNLLISILSFIIYHVPSYMESLNILVSSIMILISLTISWFLYNRNCEMLNECLQDTAEEAYELDDVGDEDPKSPEYPIKLSEDRISVHILRQLSVSESPKSAVYFAEFLLNRTTDPVIYTEAIRFIVFLQHFKESILQKILDTNPINFPLWCRQIIYDARSLVLAMNTSFKAVENQVNELNIRSLKIERSLFALMEEIQMNNKSRTIQRLSAYSHACRDFEQFALVSLINSPNSPHLSRAVANYYLQLRGDYIQSQAWNLRADIIDSSNSMNITGGSCYRLSFSGYRSHIMNIINPQKPNDSMSQNKLKSQEAIDKVKSRAIVNSSVAFCALFVILFFLMCYKFVINDFWICFSREAVVAIQSMLRALYYPIFNAAQLSLDILTNGSKTNRPAAQYSLPVQSPNLVSCAIQNITHLISQISQKDQVAELKELWLKPQKFPVFEKNKSCQFMLLQINGLSKLIPSHNSSKEEFISFLIDYCLIYIYTFSPLNNLRLKIMDLKSTIQDKQFKFILVYAIVFSVLIIFLNVLILIFLTRTTAEERDKFWSVYLEVDDKSIDTFQKSLQNEFVKHSQITSSVDDLNILAPEEIEMVENEPIVLPSSTIADDGEFEKEDYKHGPFNPRNIKAFTGYSILCIFLIIGSFCFYILLTDLVIIGSIKLSQYEYLMNEKLLNFSNFGTLCSLILIIGPKENSSEILLGYLNNSFSDFLYDFQVFQNNEIDQIYNDIQALKSRLYQSYIKWFENGTQLDEYFNEIIEISFDQTYAISNSLESWRLERFRVHLSQKNSISIMFSIFICIILIFYTISFGMNINYYCSEFNSLKSILLLLPSPYFSTVSNFICLFYPENNFEVKSLDFLKLQSRYIVKQSLDSIVVFNTKQRIIDVNKSTEELTGQKKDELIGCEISRIIMSHEEQVLLNSNDPNFTTTSTTANDQLQYNNGGSAGFFSQITYFNMQPGLSVAPKFNLHVIKTDSSLIPVSCTLIPLHRQQTDDEDSPAFAMVICDRTMFTEQEKKLQETKKCVESLLYRILPRVMATKLLSHNQKLHSKVEKATVIFIGIVNFLEWCRDHTHTEIMEQLDVIFSMFDQNISNFPTLVKLKVINGVYMAAAGLFNEVSNKSETLESVEFAVMCAQSVAQRNAQVGSHLQLTIGINTGGPIIAGILGSDKPLFDIWGDAVNISARLQTSCPYNHIQMSLETKEALPEGIFDLKMKEGVYLKGKGYTNTFVISLENIMK